MPFCVEKPPHVPAELVVDVDIYDLPNADPDPQLAWKALDRPGGPGLVWTSHNGGHWIITSGKKAMELLADSASLSSSSIRVPPVEAMYPLIPSEADAPDHRHYRTMLLPFFTPKAVAALADSVRALARELITDIAPRGHCEFMSEFAYHVPMLIFLRLVELPASDRPWLLSLSEIMARSNDLEKRTQAQADVVTYLQKWIDQRTDKPGTDLLSAIIHGKVGNRPMTHAEIMGESMTVLFGGLDTVATMIGFIARFLAKNPTHRQQLLENPALIPRAADELMRRHAMVSVARKAAVDLNLNGVTIRAGDMVILSTSLYAVDETVWEDPLTVDFARKRQPISTFGNGPHVCVGLTLARSEIIIMMEEWLARIPHFAIAPDDDGRILSGTVNSISSLKLIWH